LLRLDGAAAAGDGGQWRASVDAAVIGIPDNLISRFTAILEQRGLRGAADQTVYQTISNDQRWRENLVAISKYLGGPCQERPNPIFQLGEPNRLTLTKGEDRQKLVGLHLDSWDGLPLRHRNQSRNRICINLSREPRYSLFFNLPLMGSRRAFLVLRDPL
jgi:hypothetical protein